MMKAHYITTFLSAGLLTLLGAASAANNGAAPEPPPIVLNIAAQPLSDALNQFAQQSGLQVVFFSEVGRGVRAPALSGKYSAEAALKQLLANSSLQYQFIDAKTVAIKSRSSEQRRGVDKGADVAAQGDAVLQLAWTNDASKDKSGEDGVEEMLVEGERDRRQPFTDANVDIPRTINDVQPYYIFDAKSIERSGAVSVEDFLKQRLTMNTTAMTNGQMSNSGEANVVGNTSTINLRGLGADKTLILVNGRRMAGVMRGLSETEFQADLNQLPLNAIERIEVMPSSASGIYGGSAVGGVINVILKQDYVGGTVMALYDNTWDMAAPRRRVSGNYGLALEGGRTHISATASWAAATPMLLEDRVSIYQRNLDDITSRVPTFMSTSTSPWLGALPNIAPRTTTVTTLILKNNGNPIPLNSRNTYVPAGTSAATSMAELTAGLLANAGQWNMEFPRSTQNPTGLLRFIGSDTRERSLQLNLRRKMSSRLDMFVDLFGSDNRTQSTFNPLGAAILVRAAAPTNPFTTDIQIRVPDATQIPVITRSQGKGITVGALLRLPGAWTAGADYTWSESSFDSLYSSQDFAVRNADLLSGALNPFVDSLLHPIDFQKYLYSSIGDGVNRTHDFMMRASGPLPALPWGVPQLTAGLQRRIGQAPERVYKEDFPITVESSFLYRFYARESVTDSAYLEALVPLVRPGTLPLVYALELQVAGRIDRSEVDTGTLYEQVAYNLTPPDISYGGATLNDQPYFTRGSHASNNYTLGFKYQPVKDLALRLSQSTAFLPPVPTQLLADPLTFFQKNGYYYSVIDRVTGLPVEVDMLSGGNPDLKPQNSLSLNAGLIWEPRWTPLSGLRLNLEYYRIQQFDAIGYLSAQQLIDQEANFPGRVQRGSDGRITLVNTTSVNLFHRYASGLDLSASYAFNTPLGRFGVRTMGSMIQSLKNQYSQSLPASDAVDFPSENGAAKYKMNASLDWERDQWAAGWTLRHFGSYKQWGAAGGPFSTESLSGGSDPYYLIRQGSDTVSAQTYHDLFLSYTFGRSAGGLSGALRGVSLQAVVRNVFDKVPPLDVYYSTNFYLSPYGDTQLRNWSLSVQ